MQKSFNILDVAMGVRCAFPDSELLVRLIGTPAGESVLFQLNHMHNVTLLVNELRLLGERKAEARIISGLCDAKAAHLQSLADMHVCDVEDHMFNPWYQIFNRSNPNDEVD